MAPLINDTAIGISTGSVFIGNTTPNRHFEANLTAESRPIALHIAPRNSRPVCLVPDLRNGSNRAGGNHCGIVRLPHFGQTRAPDRTRFVHASTSFIYTREQEGRYSPVTKWRLRHVEEGHVSPRHWSNTESHDHWLHYLPQTNPGRIGLMIGFILLLALILRPKTDAQNGNTAYSIIYGRSTRGRPNLQVRFYPAHHCSHTTMIDMGQCDDFLCRGSRVFQCNQCAHWFCPGDCDREGTGTPPLKVFARIMKPLLGTLRRIASWWRQWSRGDTEDDQYSGSDNSSDTYESDSDSDSSLGDFGPDDGPDLGAQIADTQIDNIRHWGPYFLARCMCPLGCVRDVRVVFSSRWHLQDWFCTGCSEQRDPTHTDAPGFKCSCTYAPSINGMEWNCCPDRPGRRTWCRRPGEYCRQSLRIKTGTGRLPKPAGASSGYPAKTGDYLICVPAETSLTTQADSRVTTPLPKAPGNDPGPSRAKIRESIGPAGVLYTRDPSFQTSWRDLPEILTDGRSREAAFQWLEPWQRSLSTRSPD